MISFRLGATLIATLCLATSVQAMTMESIETRIGLGLTPDAQGFPGFFANGFTQGDTSHTDTISFNDGVVQVDLTLTIEAFDAGGAPAGLIVNNSATGVEFGVVNNQIDPGESIKVTYDDISFSTIGAPPMGFVDPSSFSALLSSIRFAAFDAGTDTYTYSGVGAGSTVGDDTDQLSFLPNYSLSNGDMFTITADSGAFRALYISGSGNYKVIPEPATIGLLALSTVVLATKRRVR